MTKKGHKMCCHHQHVSKREFKFTRKKSIVAIVLGAKAASLMIIMQR